MAVNLREVRNPHESSSPSDEDESPNPINVQVELDRTPAPAFFHKDSAQEGRPTDIQVWGEVPQALSAANHEMACRNHFDRCPANFPFAHAVLMQGERLSMTRVAAPNLWNLVPNLGLYIEPHQSSAW